MDREDKLHKKEEKIHKKVEKLDKKDKKLHAAIKKVHEKEEKHPRKKRVSKGERKIERTMEEYKEGKLHSGSKKGPLVKNRKQAIAIALSEARKAKASIKKKRK